MSSMMDNVDKRTQLAGANRVELLLFSLLDKQAYGINVFKIREIIPSIGLTLLPCSHPSVRGIAHIRGLTIPILDMSASIGGRALAKPSESLVLVTEYNQAVQGFLISQVNRIINTTWDAIHPPPSGAGNNTYLTAVTEFENQLIEIIDVEKILQETCPANTKISEDLAKIEDQGFAAKKKILLCDDSSVARKQVTDTIAQLGIDVVVKKNGMEAYKQLVAWVEEGIDLNEHIHMLISDIEMPEMDGYKLTTEIRNNPDLKDVYVVLHTSLSGCFNSALVEKVGANRFISKFKADGIASVVTERIEMEKEELEKKK